MTLTREPESTNKTAEHGERQVRRQPTRPPMKHAPTTPTTRGEQEKPPPYKLRPSDNTEDGMRQRLESLKALALLQQLGDRTELFANRLSKFQAAAT